VTVMDEHQAAYCKTMLLVCPCTWGTEPGGVLLLIDKSRRVKRRLGRVVERVSVPSRNVQPLGALVDKIRSWQGLAGSSGANPEVHQFI
jgi:hypothetical protein